MSARATENQTPTCPRCGGRLRLRPDQMGTEVICPKCSARFVVGSKAAPPVIAVDEDDAYLPEVPLVRSAIVPEAPRAAKDHKITHDPAPSFADDEAYEPERPLAGGMFGDEQRYEETLYEGINHTPTAGYDADHFDVEQATRRPTTNMDTYLAAAEARGLLRPHNPSDPPPRWTFFSGVLTFPFQGPNFLRWFSNVLIAALAGPFMFGFVQALFGREGPSLGTILLILPLTLLAAALGMYLAACFVTAVQDTSDGFRLVQTETMPDFREWWILLLGLINVTMVSGAIGYPFTLVPEIGPIAVPIAMAIFFPIMTLSAMEADNFFLPLSAPTWGSLTRYWWAWAVFYLLTSALIFGVLTAIKAGLESAETATSLLAGPLLVTAAFIYARLLGRLAWRIGGDDDSHAERRAPAPRREPDEPPPPRKRKKKLGRTTAADLDAAADFLAPQRPKK